LNLSISKPVTSLIALYALEFKFPSPTGISLLQLKPSKSIIISVGRFGYPYILYHKASNVFSLPMMNSVNYKDYVSDNT
jgi:hypothetical protein